MSSREPSGHHVALLLPTLGGGGTERFAVTLAPALVARGWRVTLLVGDARGPMAAHLPPSIDVVELPSPHAPRALVPLARMLRSRAPDVVLGLLAFGAYLGLLRSLLPAKTKLVTRLSINVSDILDHELAGDRVWSRARRRALEQALRRVDGVVVQSDDMQRDLLCRVPRVRRVERLPNPVQEPTRAAPSSWRPIARETPRLVAVGRLDAQKGYDVLLTAFASLVRERPGASLVVYGEGPMREQLAHMIDGLGLTGSVEIAGFRDDAMERASEADLFVSSSVYEGLSNALIEALSRGMRVLVTDCPGGNREIVEDGENGFVCAASSTHALVEGMRRALSTTPRRAPDRIARDIMATHGIAAVADRYDAFLREVAGAR